MATTTGSVLVENILRQLDGLGLISASGSFAVGNARAGRDSALKQLGIQRKRLLFERKTGLRDIKKTKNRALEAAINDALDRGIFNSGIIKKNADRIRGDAADDRGDLRTDIGLSLEELKARREGLNAQKFGGSGSSSGQLSAAEAAAAAAAAAAEFDETAAATTAQGGSDEEAANVGGGGAGHFPV